MSKELKLTKDNKKSSVYENQEYIVKISEINGYFLKPNNSQYVEYDCDLEDDEYKFVEAVKLEITNKITGRTTQKRCYQGFNVINDVQNDLYNAKSHFESMFKKID